MKISNKIRSNATGLLLVLPLFLVVAGMTVHADSMITIHLDYKIILNPADGTRPANATDANIHQAVADMNALKESYWRGYRFVVDRIIDVGGVGSEVSQWYNVNFFDAPTDSTNYHLELAAESNTGLYGWVNHAINMYITNGICGGISSFPPIREIVVIGQCSAGNGPLQLHEIGHYFNLCHTQGCPCGGCDNTFTAPCNCGVASCVPLNNTGQCSTSPGDDEVDDTLDDLTCWSVDELSIESYGSPYAALTAWQQAQVDLAASNNMAYNDDPPKCAPPVSLSEGQLDRWADAADENANRRDVRDGYTRFVSTSGSSSPDGTSGRPYGSVLAGVSAASVLGGDIILMRPGAYNEAITISKPVTLRATRHGHAYIGTATLLRKMTDDERLARETTVEMVERLKAITPTRFDTSGTVCGTAWDD